MGDSDKYLRFEGAQHFRQRLVLSLLSGRPVRISSIRLDAKSPGLAEYEVNFLRLLESVTNGSKIVINYSGTNLLFRPGVLSETDHVRHNCSLQRAIGYYLEPMVILGLFSRFPLRLTLAGITNNQTDLSVDAIRTVILPFLKHFGVSDDIELKILKRGAEPLGGGEVFLCCPNVKALKPVQLMDYGKVKRVRGIAYSTRVSPQFAGRMVESARELLNKFIPDVYIYTDHYKGTESGLSPGYAITLVAETTTGCLYSAEYSAGKGQSPEDLGKRATRLLCAMIARRGCLDSATQFTALSLMALGTEDISKIRFGPLTPASIEYLRLIKRFFGVCFKIKHSHDDNTTEMICKGVGYINLAKKVT